jgi:hypothetical protein
MLARREFLKGASVAAVAGFSGLSARISRAETVPYSTGTEPPKTKAPPNACDCHMNFARYFA